MDISFLLGALTLLVSLIVGLITVTILWKTIQNAKVLHEQTLLNELVKQEREIRIKLSEYRDMIRKMQTKNEDWIEITLDYDTLLFNYYEYFTMCIREKLVNEKHARKYFKQLLGYARQLFEDSILFEKRYARKEEYPGIQWIFRRWDIKY